MTETTKPRDALKDTKLDVKIVLSSLWAATMFCFVYGDYFGLYQHGTIQNMMAGIMGPLGRINDTIMLGVSTMMAIPAVMIFLSIILPPTPNRILNILFGVVYTVIMGLTMIGAAPYYIFFGIIEVCLTLLVVFFSATWPKVTQTNG